MTTQRNAKQRNSTKGQALVLVTLALVAMIGLIGLAVDLGWMFFIKRQAQSAADAAAMAAVQEALNRMGGVTSGFICPTSPGPTDVSCTTTPVDCATVGTTSNLNNGCQYAAKNGFVSGANPVVQDIVGGGTGSSQSVTMQAGDSSTSPPTAPGVNSIAYWVTVRVTRSVPQLFSAVLGNTTGLVAARATAGIVSTIMPGSVYTLNREGDCVNGTCGEDLNLSGNSTITAPGGVIMSSACTAKNSPTGCDGAAGESNGAKSGVTAPTILTRGSAPWPNTTTGMTDSRTFRDPTQGLQQPPLVATSAVRTCGLLTGTLGASGNTTVAGPYNYYSFHYDSKHNVIPDGNQITVSGNVSFASNGTCPGVLSPGGSTQSGTFPDYFFYGGLNVANNTVTFGPGQYVMAGTQTGVVFNAANQSLIQSSGSGSSYAGNMFIFTAPGYPGLSTQISAFPELSTAAINLYQGQVMVQGGSNTGASLNGVLKGVAPSALDPYSGVLFWQDRRNSTVEYNADGTIANAPATAAQMTANRATATSPGMEIDAAPRGLTLNGVIYQPRGAWISFQGDGKIGGAYQLITGGITMGGGGDITLTSPYNPFLQYVCALIE